LPLLWIQPRMREVSDAWPQHRQSEFGHRGGSVLRVHPNYLGYFNELAGGPSGGWRYLVDSNLDWGQDLRALKQWMDDHGVAPAVRDASGLRGRIAAPGPCRDQM
jgi:hypothetical protein